MVLSAVICFRDTPESIFLLLLNGYDVKEPPFACQPFMQMTFVVFWGMSATGEACKTFMFSIVGFVPVCNTTKLSVASENRGT